MTAHKKNKKSMLELRAGHEEFIKDKTTNKNGKKLFEKTLRK